MELVVLCFQIVVKLQRPVDYVYSDALVPLDLE